MATRVVFAMLGLARVPSVCICVQVHTCAYTCRGQMSTSSWSSACFSLNLYLCVYVCMSECMSLLQQTV